MQNEQLAQQKRNCGGENQQLNRDEVLLSWIFESVVETEWKQDLIWSNDSFPRNMMLTLLTYAYYKELWTADDIEDRLQDDASLRYICGNRRPTMEVIRHFRRGHREVVTKCLSSVFLKAFTSRPTEYGVDYEFVQRAAAELAEQRVKSAVLMEMIALDI